MRNIALLFPGQGAQYVGMGKKLYNDFSIARDVFEEANDVLKFNITKLCFEGSLGELSKTENTQPALLTVAVAASRVLLNESGIVPKYLVGHSLGEISALVCAEAINFNDAIKIVRARGRYMQEAIQPGFGKMVAINGVDAEQVNEECIRASQKGKIVEISNFNSHLQIVISGQREAVDQVGEALKRRATSIVPLKVSAPFHSRFMENVCDKLKVDLLKVTYHKFKYPVISNVTALPYMDEGNIINMLISQIINPVRWSRSMKFLQLQGIDTVIDIGPNDVVKNLMKKNCDDIDALSFDNDDGIYKSLSRQLKAPKEYKNKRLEFIRNCLTIAICTPNNGIDTLESENKDVELYRNVRSLYGKLKLENTIPTIDQMRLAIDMVATIFFTKNTPLKERKMRLIQLFEDTDTYDLFGDYINLQTS